MSKLSLLFTKGGLQWKVGKKSSATEKSYFKDENASENFILEKLEEALQEKKISRIEVICALNHFAMMPYGFDQHNLAYPLISYNSTVDENHEELMLAINKNHHVQFYYTLPKNIYSRIKKTKLNVLFNFSGEKFLSQISIKKNTPQIHIHLYENQCEFFAIKESKILLYNNLDSSAEVDFLYFIMFSVSKLNFPMEKTQFYIYGNVRENETFLSELQKFSSNVKIIRENIKNQFNFILQ